MNLLQKVLDAFGLEAEVDCEETEGVLKYSISGDDLGIIIGRRGSTLQALQLILSIVENKDEENKRFISLDIEEYRARLETSLASLAERMAEKAVREARPVSLRPMSAFERKIIHESLHDDPRVKTESDGVDPERRVIIRPD
ncbi:MAG: RNA-binding cell elongation regulator Jag/EloR [Actinomycetota bacterium]|nr:RNA-binding cell elongation regulator Jag/EloR [Actinomycetota bacterium]